IFAILAGLQLAAAVVMYKATPKGFYQLIIRFLARYCYRFTYTGIEHVPVEGPAILACNHVTYIDWLFISAAVRRPPQFVMSYMYMNLPLMDWFAKETDIIPIAPKTEGKDTLEQAYERIHEAIQIGDLVGLFPEGSLTRTGKMNPFKRGVEKILQRDPVPVIPMALVGVWGSFFSRYGGKAMSKPFRRVFSRIELRIGEPMPPDSTAHEIALRIAQLGGYEPPPSEEVSEPSTPAPEH
ncbi:MAG: 1-acyl-sn-glycerol-3-phosphate acyltransferase, partial [Myxococcota bacterium]